MMDKEADGGIHPLVRSRTLSLQAELHAVNPQQNQKQEVILKWETTLLHVIEAVVAVKAVQTRAFDTDSCGAYHATAFVVGKSGLLLSNRHVVSAGPLVAKAIFSDYEEIDIRPVYRDPVHDFGFFQFDPAKVKSIMSAPSSPHGPNISILKLNPDAAQVGTDIRVIGNDAGEKLSILQGTLARKDRPAPDYGIGVYCDFNTFYLQAASSVSGGSSGSPVVNIHGECVALNAGASNRSSASYFLPLDRVKRALELIETAVATGNLSAVVVPRGTIQVEWVAIALDEARRMGLRPDIEARRRQEFPESGSVLVAKTVVPLGPADGWVEEGDILVAVKFPVASSSTQGSNQKSYYINGFSALEALQDDNVGNELVYELQRAGQLVKVAIRIQDLHSITPSSFVEFGDGTVHDLSYMIARSYSIPARGVFVACSGNQLCNAGIRNKSIIRNVNDCEVKTLQDFIDAMALIPDGQTVRIRHCSIDSLNRLQFTSIKMNRRLFPFRLAERNDSTGLWDFTDIPYLNGRMARFEASNSTLGIPTMLSNPHSVLFQPASASMGEEMPPNLDLICLNTVLIRCELPFLLDGNNDATLRTGIGIIVDPYMGIALTSRYVVPVSTCSVEITLASHETVSARVVFVDSRYPFVFLAFPVMPTPQGYSRNDVNMHVCTSFPCLEWWDGNREDPQRSSRSSSSSDKNKFPQSMVGMSVFAITFPAPHNKLVPNVKRTRIIALHNQNFGAVAPPRYRPLNLETLGLDPQIPQGGLLVTTTGKLCGFTLCTTGSGSDLIWFALASFPVAALMNRLRSFVLSHQLHAKSGLFVMNKSGRFTVPHNEPVGSTSKGIIGGSYHLEVELSMIPLSEASKRGLTSDWIRKLSAGNVQQSILQVSTVFCTARQCELQTGDLIIAINGMPVLDFGQLALIEFRQFRDSREAVLSVLVFRDGREQVVSSALNFTSFQNNSNTNRNSQILYPGIPLEPAAVAVGWCGMLLQIPYQDALRQTSASIPAALPPELREQIALKQRTTTSTYLESSNKMLILRRFPYIACCLKGSPAEGCGLTSGYYILRMGSQWLYSDNWNESDQEFVERILATIQAATTASIGGDLCSLDGPQSVRLQLMNRSGVKQVLSIQPDEHYWSTWTLMPGEDRQGSIAYPFKRQSSIVGR